MTNPLPEKDIDALLPFFVNGTLEGAEKSAVAEAIAADPKRASQVKALERVRDTIKTAEPETQSPGEAGLTRLLAEINQIDGANPAAGRVANTNAAPLWQRVGGYAIAASIGAMAVLAFGPSSVPDDFAVPASGEVGFEVPQSTLSVMFAQGAVLADVAAALRAENLVIVDGPSARGVFLLADLEGGALSVAQADRLRALSTLFETVDDPE